jgi:hypothetical protein
VGLGSYVRTHTGCRRLRPPLISVSNINGLQEQAFPCEDATHFGSKLLLRCCRANDTLERGPPSASLKAFMHMEGGTSIRAAECHWVTQNFCKASSPSQEALGSNMTPRNLGQRIQCEILHSQG